MRQPKRARKQKEKEISDDETPKKKPVSSRDPIILENCVQVTPEGYPYATVDESDIEKFHSKEQIIDMLTNSQQICNIRKSGWFLETPPPLPPLTSEKGCFAFYLNGKSAICAKDLTTDELKPWSGTRDPLNPKAMIIKPNVRRHPIAFLDGNFKIVSKEAEIAEYHLTEYTARLPRDQRLKKKVFYMTRDNKTFGNVLIIYNYTDSGVPPTVIVKEPKVRIRKPRMSNKKRRAARIGLIMDEDDVDFRKRPHNECHENVMKVTYKRSREVPAERWRSDPLEELHKMDTFGTGFDAEFMESEAEKKKNNEGFYEKPRVLSTGHVFLTVRHMKTVTNLDQVLHFIANSNIVDELDVMNHSKPLYPPLVTNAGGYAFFVNGASILSRSVNHDSFSPWSSNGKGENPTKYRSKTRKIGARMVDGQFRLDLKKDYKECLYHLVSLYTINPRETRLRKKIFYMVETESTMVISCAMILYEYATNGEIPGFGPAGACYYNKIEEEPPRPQSLPPGDEDEWYEEDDSDDDDYYEELMEGDVDEWDRWPMY
ncbi:hypothetical protein GCK72_007356 [Caenorhabditis remanei]|uniref:DUF7747 domain-containing protein n=1 Tax=Caenorhabditis remanei TaxID=31234 RepID=A0A6A5HLR2_CAERE|nr:hypothetical protein GCK72_007356 [Caenorhabditis remanei]KAF1767397.1 hypothetical protein GCK72_007356 [Caenorhabditis remanei]